MKKKEVWDEDRIKEACLCPSCGSYVDCKETGFCYPSVGKSKCITKENGCLCPACPVQPTMGYTRVYYCTRGSDAEQAVKR